MSESFDGGDGDGFGGDEGAEGSAGASSWNPPASQADLDRIIESRLARERAKFADYDALRDKASKLDALEWELTSETEKAAQRAHDDAWNAAMSKSVPRVVRAEFRAEAKGVLSSDQLDALLEDIDLSRYVDDDGEPDTAKISAKIAKFAPAPEPERRFPDLGAGNRGGAARAVNMNDIIRRAAGISG